LENMVKNVIINTKLLTEGTAEVIAAYFIAVLTLLLHSLDISVKYPTI